MISDKDLNRIIGRVALRVQADIKQNAPVVTGRFKNSIQVENPAPLVWTVYSDVEYSKYLELGTKPHVIEAKNKKALFWDGASNPVKKVNHPGTSGKFLFLNASRRAQKYLQQELNK